MAVSSAACGPLDAPYVCVRVVTRGADGLHALAAEMSVAQFEALRRALLDAKAAMDKLN